MVRCALKKRLTVKSTLFFIPIACLLKHLNVNLWDFETFEYPLNILQEARSVVIARNLEISEVERGLGKSIKAVENEIKKTLMSIDNVASDEANLETKIEKKRQELERNQKRLATLQSVRYACTPMLKNAPRYTCLISLFFLCVYILDLRTWTNTRS